MTLLPPNRKSANRNTWILFFLCVLLVAVLSNPSQLYFLNDDFIHIPMAYDGTVGHHNGTRYVMDFSLYTDSLIWKENAAGYHLTNLILYIADLLLAIPLLRKISVTLGFPLPDWQILVMVSLFGVYAFHSEALFWILCRTATLSFFFNLLSWHCFFFALKQRWWIIPMVAFFLLGIFTYESLWVYPIWLLLWYWLAYPKSGTKNAGVVKTGEADPLPPDDFSKRSALLPIGIIWGIFIAYFPFRLMKQGELLGKYEADDIQEFRLSSVVIKTAKLFARSFLPPVGRPLLFLALAGVVAVAVVIFAWLIWKSRKTNLLLAFLVLAWLIAYLPYIALGVSTNGYESERYLYYPSFFLCAAFVYAVFLLFQDQPLKRNLIFLLAFSYNIFFLARATTAYQTISRYSQMGIEAVKAVPAGKQLVIRNLPVYSYGLPVFNYGFDKAVAWLAPQIDTGSMQILQRVNFNKQPIQVHTVQGAMADTLIFTEQH